MDTHWHFYKPRPTRNEGLSDGGWEDWPENQPRETYVDPETTPILGGIEDRDYRFDSSSLN